MKKVIKIAHLYYDLLNLYGEAGNIRAIKEFIERNGIDVEIHFLTIGDKINFKDYDFYYIGQGSEENRNFVLKDLMNYKKEIKEAIENNKVFLATGNAMELFGKSIINDKNKIECLNIFEYSSITKQNRLVKDIRYIIDKKYMLGFKNCSEEIINNKHSIEGYNDTYNKYNFFGFNFVGPLLIRSPYFTNKLIEIILNQKNINITLPTNTIEFEAYNNILKNEKLKDTTK